jgi:hypothetical protein
MHLSLRGEMFLKKKYEKYEYNGFGLLQETA